MPSKVSSDGGKTNVLLVEDDVFLSGIYQKKFEMEGFKVVTADNGEKALVEAKKKKPNIILLDILLPKLDGFAVLEKLKADAETKEIPVILLTNLGQKDDVEKGLEAGAADYLIKAHFKPSEVVDKVRKVLHLE
jgi:DNA-binding response OmpR family regulator